MRRFVCILLSVVLLFSTTGCDKRSQPPSYENTKAEALDLFYAKKDEFLAVVEEFERSGATDFTIEGVSSISCKEDGDYKCIEFKIDAYGFLGGQYWMLSYHSGNYPYNSWGFKLNDLTAGPYAGSYYWQENPNEGNNFLAIERIEEGWFFHYMDFDGNGHGLDWAKIRLSKTGLGFYCSPYVRTNLAGLPLEGCGIAVGGDGGVVPCSRADVGIRATVIYGTDGFLRGQRCVFL